MINLVVGYLDPGAGALLWQAAIGGFLAVVVFFRTRIAALLSVFKKKK
jgi:hypothetical protein